jgi:hypothetical protein
VLCNGLSVQQSCPLQGARQLAAKLQAELPDCCMNQAPPHLCCSGLLLKQSKVDVFAARYADAGLPAP